MKTAKDLLGMCESPYQKSDSEILKATGGDDKLAQVVRFALQLMDAGGDEEDSIDQAIKKFTKSAAFAKTSIEVKAALSKLGVEI